MQDHNFPRQRYFQKQGFLEGRIALQILTQRCNCLGGGQLSFYETGPKLFLRSWDCYHGEQSSLQISTGHLIDSATRRLPERLFLHITNCTHQPPVEPGICTISDLHVPLRANPMETLLRLTRTQSRDITGRNG
jgi:hypothetical protein